MTKTLAAMSLLAPLTAHSLGVGDLKLHSALNQKLNAEIALTLAENEDLADIKVTLATPDKFDKLGIEWSYFLSKVKFQPVLKANGKFVIKMTSDEVVQEPFLDFLVEVSWPKGDIYKEFTVLVDPPVVYQPSRVAVPVTSFTQPDRIATPAQNDFSSLAVIGEYGPIGRSDSLWKVAEKVNKHSDVSIQQMMMALYRANPHAFYKKNVNALMEGKSLKIPEKSEILQLSNQQANTQFNRQMAVWEGKAAPRPGEQIASATARSNQLTLAPPAEEELTHTETLTANVSDIDHSATERLTAENMQLQQRLANMEKQVAIMQDMMAIKDEELAVMQDAQSSLVQDLNTTSALEKDRQTALEQAKAELEQQILIDEADKVGVIPDMDPVLETDTQDSVAVQTAPVKTAPVKPPVKPPVQKESGVNYYYMGVGLFSALVIGGLGLLFWRRRQAEEELNDSSMFASSSEIFLPDNDAEDELDVPVFDNSADYGVGTVGESSFLSEFTPSDFDVFESDQAEVDPTSEADVYLAYGRYQQAEELMRQAISEHAENDDYKLKLLEIFYTSENGEGFEGYATDLQNEGKNSDLNFWTKVTEMGKELVPESTLFSPEQTESTFDATDLAADTSVDIAESASAEVAEEVSNDVEEMSNDVEASVESITDDNSDLDFDLSSFSLTDDAEDELDTSEVNSTDDSDIGSVDFDLSSFETIATISADNTADLSSIEESDDAIETIEFNIDETDDISLENFDFSAEDSNSVELQGELELDSSEESKAEAVEELTENNDFDFDFDEPAAEQATDSNEDDLIVADLTDMDELETKIDLAKAYIDMGDESSAKEIAQEVIEKGNDVQKQEAQAIIDKLS